jgi:aminodeoxyfutalosine synthase
MINIPVAEIKIPDIIKPISDKIINGQRISAIEALELFKINDLSVLSFLASIKKRQINGKNVFFNRNIHIEPTNICINNCRFCSYRRNKNEDDSWELSIDQIISIINNHISDGITEVHIVGGTHPDKDAYYYSEMLKTIHKNFPFLHIKAFTAVELDYMFKKANLTIADGLELLINSGLNSIPGGGAEIFNKEIRKKICPEKIAAEKWLEIHKEAHKYGIPSNATMLYGHLESYEHRIEHMELLRNMQDITGGFQAFIPLKFRNKNNSLSYLPEVTLIEDLKNFAVSRLFIDNIKHIKAYWPMLGKDAAEIAILFGVDDLDGTIEDTTKIYTMAGAEEKNPSMTVDEITKIIKKTGSIPVERNSVYDIIKIY